MRLGEWLCFNHHYKSIHCDNYEVYVLLDLFKNKHLSFGIMRTIDKNIKYWELNIRIFKFKLNYKWR